MPQVGHMILQRASCREASVDIDEIAGPWPVRGAVFEAAETALDLTFRLGKRGIGIIVET
jgi:hypothetical protein